MPADIQQLLKELKQGLAGLYGKRLTHVYLYGSYARGDHQGSSDVDIMIVLDDYKNYWQELVRSGELVSNLSLQYGVSISRVVVRREEWRSGDTPLLQNIRAEGVAA